MNVQQLVERKTIAIIFSREFEALLLNFPSDHLSLTHDLELAAQAGVLSLEELEDAHDLKHVEAIKNLIAKTNGYLNMESEYFKQWSINISVDLLDEVDLLILTHGDDLKTLGLTQVSQGSVLVLLAVAACTNFNL